MLQMNVTRLADDQWKEFEVVFKPTARNKAGAEMLKELGFAPTENGYVRPLALPFADAEIVRLTQDEARAA